MPIGRIGKNASNEQINDLKNSIYHNGGQVLSIGYSYTDSKIISSNLALYNIRGKGSTSWEASCKYFGKYPYNVIVSNKILPEMKL